ncbi:MAG: cytochrome c3 family protein [Candidatus Angelobacter sp.]|jgi:predicted CXXCH cytochrome family protein
MATLQNKSAASHTSRWFLAMAAGLLLAGAAHGQTKNSCLECHSILTDNLGVTEEKFSQDIHAQKGLTCASCHGGDATNDDPEIAMGKKAGFKGKITRAQIPQLCGSCHSDPAVMRKYNPSLRTDQLSQYHTSIHGKRLATGDTKVAVCVDCHSVHDIRPPNDPRSTVYPLNVPATCSRCHSDAERMKEYKIPTNQFAEYKKSVHYEALTVRGDLSAPTCVTCHGNHGATPPGASSVAAVCSTCHVFQAQLFDASPHKAAFASAGLPGCVTCHSNHGIQHPTDALIGTDDKSVCGQCHTEGDPGFVAANNIRDHLAQLAAAIDRSDQILSKAERSGMEVSQARLDLVQTRDTLTKARVTIHSVNVARVQQDIQPGLVAADKNYEAGKDALKERNYRRYGLGLSLIAIAIVITGLKMYLKQIESGQDSQTT